MKLDSSSISHRRQDGMENKWKALLEAMMDLSLYTLEAGQLTVGVSPFKSTPGCRGFTQEPNKANRCWGELTKGSWQDKVRSNLHSESFGKLCRLRGHVHVDLG